MELELDMLHKARILAEDARVVQTTIHADASGPIVAAGRESGSAGGNLDQPGEGVYRAVEKGRHLQETGAAASGS